VMGDLRTKKEEPEPESFPCDHCDKVRVSQVSLACKAA
jgi:hypothetical protein